MLLFVATTPTNAADAAEAAANDNLVKTYFFV